MISCREGKSDIQKSKEKVLLWFDIYAGSPFLPRTGKLGLKHPDYWGLPGVEGTQISIVDRRIEIVNATHFIGDKTLYGTRTEQLIRIDARLKQHFCVDGLQVTKIEKEIDIAFYFSKHGTANGEYLIINHSPYEYDIYFEDAMRKYLNTTEGSEGHPKLRESLINAGMSGIR